MNNPLENETKRKEYWLSQGVKDTNAVIAIHPGSRNSRKNKRWPIEHFASLIQKTRTTIDSKIILLIGPDDQDSKILLNDSLLSDIGILIPDDLRSIFDLGAINSHCNFLICNDSFAMHVAIATRTPCIALFGPTSEYSYPNYEFGNKIRSERECSTDSMVKDAQLEIHV